MMTRDKLANILSNPLVFVFLILQIIIITFLVISIPRVDHKNKPDFDNGKKLTVSIDNLEELLPGIRQQEKESLEGMLYNIIRFNTDSFSHDIEINVKDESLIKKNFPTVKLRYYNFVVDIPSLKQEYQVALSAPNDSSISPDDSVVISCLERNKTYKESSCHIPDGASTKTEVINRYIDYTDFGDMNVYASLDEPGEIIIDITGSEANKEEAVVLLQKWIESMGYSDDGFILKVYNG